MGIHSRDLLVVDARLNKIATKLIIIWENKKGLELATPSLFLFVNWQVVKELNFHNQSQSLMP